MARTLEFPRIITRVERPEFESVCVELGIQDTIVPDRAVAQELQRVVRGEESAALTALVKSGVRVFSFVASSKEEGDGDLADLDLGERSRVIAVNRNGKTLVATDEIELEEKDEVIVIAHEDELENLEKRFRREEDRARRRDSGTGRSPSKKQDA